MLGAIMSAGMYAWAVHTHFYPALAIILFICITLIVYRAYPVLNWRPFIDRSDLYSISGALLGIFATCMTFFGVYSGLPSTIQFITNGFDNGAHISLINTTYKNQGYVYGPYETIKDQIAWKTLTAYPQGWHLATMSFFKGIGINPNSNNTSPLLSAYAYVFVLWMFVASYLMGKVIWGILEIVKPSKLLTTTNAMTFLACIISIQILVLWGAQYFGFATFVSAVVYFMLLFALIVDMYQHGKADWVYILLLLHIMSAIAQAWLLPVVIAGVMSLLAFIVINKNVAGAIEFLKLGRVPTYLLAVFLVIPAFVIVGISRAYSVQGANQINDEGGIFLLSSLLVGVIAIGTFVMVLFRKEFKKIIPLFITCISPITVFVGLIYMYQLNTLGHTAYFFTKVSALLLIFTWVFSSVIIIYFLARLQFQYFGKISHLLVILMLFIPMFLYSGQDVRSLKYIIPKGAQMDAQTAGAYATVAQDGRLKNTNVIVFTRVSDVAYGADVTGNVLSTSINTHIHPCVGGAIWLITDAKSSKFPAWIDTCTKDHDQKVTIITSNETQPLIAALNNPNITTVVSK